jgi:hypothetical protein
MFESIGERSADSSANTVAFVLAAIGLLGVLAAVTWSYLDRPDDSGGWEAVIPNLEAKAGLLYAGLGTLLLALVERLRFVKGMVRGRHANTTAPPRPVSEQGGSRDV